MVEMFQNEILEGKGPYRFPTSFRRQVKCLVLFYDFCFPNLDKIFVNLKEK